MRKCTILSGTQTIDLDGNISQKKTRDMLKPMNKVMSLGGLHTSLSKKYQVGYYLNPDHGLYVHTPL